MEEIPEEELNAAYQGAWAVFAALERDDTELANEITALHRADAMAQGAMLVATVLRRSLIHHTENHDCDCGSDAWLKEQVLRADPGRHAS